MLETLTKIVCDLCSADVIEAWFFRHRAFDLDLRPHYRIAEVDAGEVAACAECKPYADRRDAPGSLSRVQPGACNPFVIRFHFGIMANLSDVPPRYVILGQFVLAPARFFESKCPSCPHVFHLDRQDAVDQAIRVKCPVCHADVLIGAVGHRTET